MSKESRALSVATWLGLKTRCREVLPSASTDTQTGCVTASFRTKPWSGPRSDRGAAALAGAGPGWFASAVAASEDGSVASVVGGAWLAGVVIGAARGAVSGMAGAAFALLSATALSAPARAPCFRTSGCVAVAGAASPWPVAGPWVVAGEADGGGAGARNGGGSAARLSRGRGGEGKKGEPPAT